MQTDDFAAWADIDDTADVVLVSPPFVFPPVPSTALSIFRTCLNEDSVTSRVIYPMFLLSHIMGEERVKRIAEYPSVPGIDEFLFAHLTDVNNENTVDDFIDTLAPGTAGEDREYLKELINSARVDAQKCIEITARKIVNMGARIVAASSIFSQQNGSLSIFKRVKELNPSITTLMGGTNVTGAAGAAILRHYKSVDYVFFGEGDEAFAETCRALMEGSEDLPYGVVSLKTLDENAIPHRMTKDMNTAPMPDFSDFIEEWKRELGGFYGPSMLGNNYDEESEETLYLEGRRYPIYIEGSRGCWWGQKNKCTFCGLNGLKNVYRSKSWEKLHEDIRDIAEHYPGKIIQLTDNVLSMDVVRKLLPKLIEDKADYKLIGEVKTNITEEDIRNLKKAGFLIIQPGIESLNDHILTLMGKGNTGVNHVAFLKYCRTCGLLTYWNLLYGNPGEDIEDYEEMIELSRKIVHFQPPVGTFQIMFQIFSKYYDSPQEYGLELTPSKLYRFYYGNDEDRIRNLAFYYDLSGGRFKEESESHREVYDRLVEAVKSWRILYFRKEFFGLTMSENDGGLFLVDSRPGVRMPFYVLEGAACDIYRLAWNPVAYEKIIQELPQYREDEIKEELKKFIDNDLMIFLSGKYLALALPKSAI